MNFGSLRDVALSPLPEVLPKWECEDVSHRAGMAESAQAGGQALGKADLRA